MELYTVNFENALHCARHEIGLVQVMQGELREPVSALPYSKTNNIPVKPQPRET